MDYPFEEKLKELKKKIRGTIEQQLEKKKGYNEYHRKLVDLGYDDILTTNYDYAFQLSADENFFDKGNYEDLSLVRVGLGYGIPTLLALALSAAFFCWRDL